MTIGWAPFAIIEPGPEWKHGYPNVSETPADLREGFVYHSMVGSLSASHNELHRPDRRASWTFSNPKIGPLIQHYPVYYQTWANGSPLSNTKFGSCENEGGPPGNESEPLTQNQIDNLVELTVWLYHTQEWDEIKRPV